MSSWLASFLGKRCSDHDVSVFIFMLVKHLFLQVNKAILKCMQKTPWKYTRETHVIE